ncbi:MAG: helix-turn-helix domain-containing protein [Clostridia bacterium]|nr:helix-turn-helix domain-containing protein [Clostridia bacterium]
MSDIGTKEASIKWGVSQKTIQRWCREGKIPNATQDGKGSPWHIPINAKPPRDKQ